MRNRRSQMLPALCGMAMLLVIKSAPALSAASTYKSKGSEENPRHTHESCRLAKVQRDAEGTKCIYRRQSKGKDVIISNPNPKAPCQSSFQCKRIR
jgi:hypothetical protein